MQLRINVENCDSVHKLAPTGLYESANTNIRERIEGKYYTPTFPASFPYLKRVASFLTYPMLIYYNFTNKRFQVDLSDPECHNLKQVVDKTFHTLEGYEADYISQ